MRTTAEELSRLANDIDDYLCGADTACPLSNRETMAVLYAAADQLEWALEQAEELAQLRSRMGV